jgi:hypothetical protein
LTRSLRPRLAAFAILLYSVAAVLVAVVLAQSAPAAPTELHLPRTAVFAVGIFAFAIPAALVIGRHPSNLVGWVLAWVAVTSGITDVSAGYGAIALYGTGLPGGSIAAWLFGWTYALALGPASTLLFLLFPTGRLPSRAWRPVAWLALLATAGIGLSYAVLPGPIPLFPTVAKPFTVGSGDAVVAAAAAFATLFLVTTIASAASLWYRARHAGSVERQQLKLLAYAAGLVSVTTIAVVVLGIPLVIGAEIITYALLAIPVAVGIAILRYRLYEIDLLIKRTVVYGATTAAIAATFFLGLVALQGALRPLTSGSDLAVAASTLVSFALFQPIRRRVQDAVDRRFDRFRYDAARTVDAFADRLRDEVDLDTLSAELISAAIRTMAPAHSSLWLRQR